MVQKPETSLNDLQHYLQLTCWGVNLIQARIKFALKAQAEVIHALRYFRRLFSLKLLKPIISLI